MKKTFFILCVIFLGFFSREFCFAYGAVDVSSLDEEIQINGEDEFSIDNESVSDENVVSLDAEQVASDPQGSDSTIDASTHDQLIVPQILTTMREQNNMQEKITKDLQQPGVYTGFFLKMFGPDFAEIKSVKKEIEIKKEKTQELERMISGIEGADMKNAMIRTLDGMKKGDFEAESELLSREKTFSLLGWFVKLFY